MSRRAFCRRCFECARTESGHGQHDAACIAYDAQLTFTRRIRRLLADPTPWHARPVPQAPVYDPRPHYDLPPSEAHHGKMIARLKVLGCTFCPACYAYTLHAPGSCVALRKAA